MNRTCQRRATKIQTACNNPTEDILCWGCLHLLRDTLLGIKEYAGELETQIARQDRGAPSVGSGSGEPKLVFDVDASEARDHVDIVLSTWFAEHAPRESHAKLQGLTIEQRIKVLLAWHLRHYIYTGRSDQAPEMLSDFDSVLARARQAVDRKSTRVWIGNCTCGNPVHAFPKQRSMATCACGQEYDPAQSRRELRVLGGEQLVTARQAEMLGEVWDRTIKKATVDKWQQRGRIECRSETCTKGHTHEYRMSELLVLHREA